MSSDVSGEHSATDRLFHTAGPLTRKTPVAVACPRSCNLQLLHIGGPEVGTAGVV